MGGVDETKYQVLGAIGQAGVGVLCEAENAELRDEVVIAYCLVKCMFQSGLVDRLKQETEILEDSFILGMVDQGIELLIPGHMRKRYSKGELRCYPSFIVSVLPFVERSLRYRACFFSIGFCDATVERNSMVSEFEGGKTEVILLSGQCLISPRS
ncbi:hypothetical protein R69619_07165 [Paraburkholderia nemoris]|nr:hypothetical protein R69619_07165 [Paraburkholderia nemoris]